MMAERPVRGELTLWNAASDESGTLQLSEKVTCR